jgi:hypothetical protein
MIYESRMGWRIGGLHERDVSMEQRDLKPPSTHRIQKCNKTQILANALFYVVNESVHGFHPLCYISVRGLPSFERQAIDAD